MRPASQLHRLPLRSLVDMIGDGHVVPAGPPGGPPLSALQVALLFDSLETGWPVGHLIAWTPPGSPAAGPWRVLDGHRRLDALRHAAAQSPARLVRDLTSTAPAYRWRDTTAADPWLMPVAHLLRQMPFLRAARTMPEHIAAHGDAVAGRLLRARVDVVALRGGGADDVLDACERLAPGRVSAATLAELAG